eukprot:14641205-Alexandrium_andersonii.AAC.1
MTVGTFVPQTMPYLTELYGVGPPDYGRLEAVDHLPELYVRVCPADSRVLRSPFRTSGSSAPWA